MMRSAIVQAATCWAQHALVGVALMVVIGCGADSAPVSPANKPAGENSAEPANAASGTRIACLSPAVTQMLADLGAADRVIAVGAYDPAAPPDVAIVGDLYRIDYEKLLSIRPTDIILQINNPTASRSVPARLAELARRHRWTIHTFKIETAADSLDALYSPDAPCVGSLIDQPDKARALRDRIEHQLDQLTALTHSDAPPRVLMVVGLSPLTCVGHGTFLDRLLTSAGGVNALDQTAGAWPAVDRERLLNLAPDIIIRFDPSRGSAAVATHESAAPEPLNLPDGLDAPIVVIDDPLALLPSTTMMRIARQLAAAIHPDLPLPAGEGWGEGVPQSTTAPRAEGIENSNTPSPGPEGPTSPGGRGVPESAAP
ncbi:ABC transporter substrate-binding protein [Planctomycetales bacterium ZRK34]|nr:ABC transporter substrate-binding protein [Planctomycetales bacterium ZRK34]